MAAAKAKKTESNEDSTPIQATVQNEGPVKRHLRVEVPAERVRGELDKAYGRLKGRAKVAGFRKGKVPRSVLEREFGAELREQVVQELIEHACARAMVENELDAVTSPRLLSHELDDAMTLKFEAELDVRPQFDLGEYKAMEMVRSIVRVEEDHVDEALRTLRERMAVTQTEEERVNVAVGDVVVFDMYGFAEGEPLENASGEGVQIEVGSGRFPEEFEKQLPGVTRGIQTPIDVHFPDDHRDPELAGKLVRFQVTVKEIKNKILPNLDDDFASEVGYDDCDTLEELRKRVRGDLESRAEVEADRRARGELLAAVVDRYSFDVPNGLVHRQVVEQLREMGVQELPEDKVDEVRQALEPGAVKQVRARFILDAVAKAEEIDVSEDELKSEINRQIASLGGDGQKVIDYYRDPAAVGGLRASMLRDKALERVAELATRRDVEVDESQLAGPQGSS